MKEAWKRLRDWIEVPSVTGGEADYADVLSRRLEELGLDVELQEVAPGRSNVLARRGRPRVVFCTHLDTVPPFFGSSEDPDFVHGRGSCDAKGPALAMLTAAEPLLAAGEESLGFLFTVGEEVDSAGARRANELLAEPWAPRYTIVGEPTENRFVRAHKGAFKGRLVASGVAGHSSQKVGPSAVHELVCCAAKLLATDWGTHRHLGPGTLNLGQIEGGVAPNVVADHASASVLLRAVESPEVCRAKLDACLTEHVRFEDPFPNYGPIEFHVPEGADPIEVAFGTDAPHMPRWGTPLLYGPGRILDAHTDHERVSKQSFELAVADYGRVAGDLLARTAAEEGS